MSDRFEGQRPADEEYFDSTANGMTPQNPNRDDEDGDGNAQRSLNLEDDRSRDNIHQGSQTAFDEDQDVNTQTSGGASGGSAPSDSGLDSSGATGLAAENDAASVPAPSNEFADDAVEDAPAGQAADGLNRQDHPEAAADISAIKTEGLLGQTEIQDQLPAGQEEYVTQEQPQSGPADVNQAPEQIVLSNAAISDDAAIGDMVGTVSAVDPEGGTFSFSLSDDAGGMFTIDATTGEITLAGTLDFASNASYDLTVDISDGTNVTQQTFSIAVQDDVNDPDLTGSANVLGTGGDDFGADKLMGTNQADDVIYGLGGDDDIMGKGGNDTLVAGGGDDSVDAGQGDDVVYGGAGADYLRGQGGNDTIYGGSGDDQITGGTGDDVLSGGTGDDYVDGGAGSDIFHFGMMDGNDTFIGGTSSDGNGWADTIVLSDGLPGGDISDWLSLTSGTVETTDAGEVFLSEDAAGTITLGNDSVLTFEGVEKIEG